MGLAGTTQVLWEFYVGQARCCTSPKMTGGKGAVFRRLKLGISIQAPVVVAGDAICHCSLESDSARPAAGI